MGERRCGRMKGVEERKLWERRKCVREREERVTRGGWKSVRGRKICKDGRCSRREKEERECARGNKTRSPREMRAVGGNLLNIVCTPTAAFPKSHRVHTEPQGIPHTQTILRQQYAFPIYLTKAANNGSTSHSYRSTYLPYLLAQVVRKKPGCISSL